ncbi:MAG: terminase [Bacilli bacterium]
MDFYTPLTEKELSQRKLRAYEDIAKVINWGRRNPIRFAEEFYGTALLDYQKLAFMESWDVPYALWLECRGAGKDTLAAVYFQTKMVLIPNYIVYVSSNSAAQSAESFCKLQDIALQRIPSFKSVTDIFAQEVEKSVNSETGFLHNPAGYKFRLYNNSQMITLSSNIETNRGKRGAVWFNETAWKSAEELAVVENFANVDSSFSTSTEKIKKIDPIQMPLQLLYTSSAGDVSYPFFEKYKTFAKKMFLGNKNYYCIDINAYDILYNTTLNGELIKSHLSEDQIKKAIEEDADLADRELFNKFRKGSGQNAVVNMDTIIRNSFTRKPLLYNDTGKKKFIFCYDPARNFDGSILGIFQIINDKEVGYKLQIENVVSMVDASTKNKTPLPMPQQLEIIKDMMIKYNGERAAEWENIEFYIDAGAGGGGVSAVADQLMLDWSDESGQKHRGIIDLEHKQYESARKKYTNAMPIVHLIDPQGYKKVIYDALGKMTKLNLIEFTSYDNKDYILIENKDGNFDNYDLNDEEKMALIQIELMKNEVSYMCRYDTPNGGVQYELAKDKKNKMHDDRSDVLALAAYALAKLRRSDLIRVEISKGTAFNFKFRQPKIKTN